MGTRGAVRLLASARVIRALGAHRRWERWPAVAAAAVLGLTAYLGAVPAADGITRDRAERIALRALKPPKKGAGRRVTVAIFGLRAPLGPRAVVSEGGPPPRATGSHVRQVRPVRRLGARTWLFWRDSRYGAMFAHPSVLLLIDDRTGRVRAKRRLDWWPLVDGRQPVFLRSASAYRSKRFKIYSDLNLAKRSRAGQSAPTAAFATASAASAQASQAPPGAFAGDCLLTLYNRDDGRFLRDVRGMEKVAAAAGIRSFRVESRRGFGPPDASDLRRATGEVVAKGCKDVLLYITAHGSKAGSVMTGETVRFRRAAKGGFKVVVEDTLISGAQITRAIADQVGQATFKVKVDTCYSGQQLRLVNLPNVLIVETSSKGNEPSYFYRARALRRGGDGKLYVLRNTRNARRRAEFTNRNVVGLQRFLERPDEIQHAVQQVQAQKTSFLAWALSRAFALGENADFVSMLGWTDPQLRAKFQVSAPN